MVGASGAISGVMAAYLVLYPRVRVNMFFFPFFIVPLPAWLVILWWFVLQVMAAYAALGPIERHVSSGVAVMAHIGGFLAGLALVRAFANRGTIEERTARGRKGRSRVLWR
jgi:membrane associated rhomboid family serine protease